MCDGCSRGCSTEFTFYTQGYLHFTLQGYLHWVTLAVWGGLCLWFVLCSVLFSCLLYTLYSILLLCLLYSILLLCLLHSTITHLCQLYHSINHLQPSPNLTYITPHHINYITYITYITYNSQSRPPINYVPPPIKLRTFTRQAQPQPSLTMTKQQPSQTHSNPSRAATTTPPHAPTPPTRRLGHRVMRQ